MKKKNIILLLVSFILLIGVTLQTHAFSKGPWSVYQQIKAIRVKDDTIMVQFKDLKIKREDIVNIKNEFEKVNQVLHGNNSYKISEGQIIKSKLVNEFLLLEAKNAGINPVSDDEANKAKDEQLTNYQKVSDDIKKIQEDKIQELGLTFDEYWNNYWIENYKKNRMISDYISLKMKELVNINKTREQVRNELKEESYNKYKNQVIINPKFNIILP